jgi:ATP-dependent phosphoenolpyruvate carboxykinase
MPRHVSGIDPRILVPEKPQATSAAYNRTLQELTDLFAENLAKIGELSELFVA